MSTIITRDGTEIYYKDWGEGPVVTFSHGWPLSADAWDAQLLFLAQHGFRVVAHDRRGHGRSSQPSSGNNMDGYADDLSDLIEALDLTDATWWATPRAAARSPAISAATARCGWPRRFWSPLCRRSWCSPKPIRRDCRSRCSTAYARPGQGSLAVLQGPGHPVLRRQPPGRRGLAGRARAVLAVEHAVRPQERLREHQGLLRDRFHRGPQEDRRPRPWSCTARTTRSFPSRTPR